MIIICVEDLPEHIIEIPKFTHLCIFHAYTQTRIENKQNTGGRIEQIAGVRIIRGSIYYFNPQNQSPPALCMLCACVCVFINTQQLIEYMMTVGNFSVCNQITPNGVYVTETNKYYIHYISVIIIGIVVADCNMILTVFGLRR